MILSFVTNYFSIRRDNRSEEQIFRQSNSLFLSKNDSLSSSVDRDVAKLDISADLNIAKSAFSIKN